MKKYRLKEEVKKYVSIGVNDSRELGFWETIGFTLEALEEVPSRIELKVGNLDTCGLYKLCENINWTDKEKDLCEKAINGELLDVDFIMDFMEYYDSEYLGMDRNHFKEILKDYLKEKRDESK